MTRTTEVVAGALILIGLVFGALRRWSSEVGAWFSGRRTARITLLEADVTWLKAQVIGLHKEIAARDALARAHTSWDYRVYAELQRLDAKTAATVGPPPTLYPTDRSAP